MRDTIEFEDITWKNFLGTGNIPITISLNTHSSTFFSGLNGSGKSTMLDAIFFALFGKPFRDINKPNLVNSKNKGHCEVVLNFKKRMHSYQIVRGIKPTKFEIYEDGVLIDQDAKSLDYQKFLETSILKTSERAFRQIVMIEAKDFVPFMRLNAGHRREFIENLLDIGIFSDMAKLNKSKMDTNRQRLREADENIKLLENSIHLHKSYAQKIAHIQKKDIDDLKKKIEAEKASLRDAETALEDAKAESNEAKKKYDAELKKFQKDESDYKKILITIANSEERLDEELSFFIDHDNCPTCKQGISHDHKASVQASIDNKKEGLLAKRKNLDGVSKALEKRRKKLAKLEGDWSDKRQAVSDLDVVRRRHKWVLEEAESDLAKAVKEAEEASAASKESVDIGKIEEELIAAKARRSELLEDRRYMEIANGLLKDGGIKTKVIREYVPIINGLINKYLFRFGLAVNFTLNEEFNEVIKSRYRDNFQYGNFSNGQKQRIDMAIILTWREIAKLKNNTNCNLLILDETFDSSLDDKAIDEFIAAIHEMETDSNIFVISHKMPLADKFKRHIRFEQHQDFSKMVEA